MNKEKKYENRSLKKMIENLNERFLIKIIRILKKYLGLYTRKILI